MIVVDGEEYNVGVARDLSERMAAEERLRESEFFLKETQRLGKMGGWRADPVANTVMWTEGVYALCEMPLDYKPALLPAIDFYLPEERQKVIDCLARTQKTGEPFFIETRVRSSRGREFPVELRGYPHYRQDGTIDYLMGTIQDIDERQRAAAELKAREAKYRAVVETADDGFWVADLDGRLLEVNDAYVRLSGYSREELLTMSVADVEAKENSAEIAARIAEITSNTALPFESQHRRKDGSIWDAAITTTYAPIDGGRIFAFLRDVTRRNRADALLLARLYLSQIALSGDIDELLRFALDTAERQTRSRIGFFHFVDPDQENLTLQAWSSNTLKNMCQAEGKGMHYPVSQAGIWVQCIVERRPVIHNDYETAAGKKGLPPGHAPIVRELTIPVLRGDRVVAVMGVGNKETLYDGEDVKLVEQLASMAIDLVDRMKAETARQELTGQLQRMVDELSASNRELSRFVEVATHDLQEPARSLVTYSQLVQRRYGAGLDADGLVALDIITTEANRMLALVKDLLSYTRVTETVGPTQPVDLNAVVQRVRDTLAPVIRETGTQLEARPLPVLTVHAGHMVQLLHNLIANAIKFRRPDVPPQVRIDAVLEGQEWVFSVADNGIGIAPREQEQIFVVFKRLHPQHAYPGTGVGLAICKRIVDQYGGRIRVESRPGEGSTFYFTLPTEGR